MDPQSRPVLVAVAQQDKAIVAGAYLQSVILPFSADGEDPMGGVGADFKLNERLAVRAEWEVFKIDEGTLDSASVGVQFKF